MADTTITIKDANGVDRTIGVVLNGGVYTFKQTLVTSDGSTMEDSTTESLKMITSPHHEIHEGDRYVVQEGIVLNGASKEYLITTPDTTKWAHLTIDVEGGQDTSISLVEDSARTGGTAMAAINRQRNAPPPAGVTVTHTPGGAAGAPTTMFTCQFGIPTVGGGKGGGGGTQQGRSEFVLKQNTKYLLTVTALSANDNNICVSIDWYEHQNS